MLAVPVLITIMPLEPEAPALAVVKAKAPLEVAAL
jgi:hypothetical protein